MTKAEFITAINTEVLTVKRHEELKNYEAWWQSVRRLGNLIDTFKAIYNTSLEIDNDTYQFREV